MRACSSSATSRALRYTTCQIRPVREEAGDAGIRELAHARRLVHGVDERDEIEGACRREPASRDAAVREANRPCVARRANRDAVADVLARAEAWAQRSCLLERRTLEANHDVCVGE